MPAKKLRALGANEAATKRAPKTVTEAVEWGSTRDLLVTLRTRIAKAVEDPAIRGADLAALSRRLMEISRELVALEAVPDDAGRKKVTDEVFDSSSV